ncbi:hypothetical protein F5Y04DRAFT_242660 [Hypomontagnella monticulosa]|nr:hypothetical protein F5Y04DRAFT_242660 [Hypomontagnella monticulosa]
MKCSAFLTICGLLATAAVAQDFSGSGEIHLINSTNFDSASLDNRIGCLDARGGFSRSNCATFTRLDVYPNSLSSRVGNCSFTDASQPANTDNPYGAHSYAFHCRPDFAASISETLYTVKGFKQTYLCHGDINCFYDVKNLPDVDVTTPVWEYLWGSQQVSIPAGHTQVLWYWNKTS